MNRRVRLSTKAQDDLDRLFDFLAEQDIAAAHRARAAIARAYGLIGELPLIGRKAGDGANPCLRELTVPFGNTGYVILYELEDATTITIASFRHQREDDYDR
ncbi:MAG: type II toxin-antitoxin system RelE/ParE family toxin [Thermomonas sp.]|uniref:type II toxin-antitoxin system RelE/ParE family toxin n=1 Tax=Thermomonas sp. TaxID=1971895 RepID=UPI0039E2BB0E